MSAGYCKRCKKYVGIGNLEASHIFGRVRKTVRWDLKNVYPLCKTRADGNGGMIKGCHQIIDNDNFEKTEFTFTVLTKEEIKELQYKANHTIKDLPIDREQIKADLKSKISTLE
jgi:phenylacetate-coenzyme A ligase PaaK-like adenylate-forming protein